MGRSVFLFELLGLISLASLGARLPVTPIVPMVLWASAGLWLRGLSFADVGLRLDGRQLSLMGSGLAIGAVIGGVLLFAFGPDTSPYLLLGGNVSIVFVAIVLTAVTALGTEMIVRGYVLHAAKSAIDGRLGLWAGLLVGCLVGGILSAPGGGALEHVASLAIECGLVCFYLAGGRGLVFPASVRTGLLSFGIVIEFLGA